MNKWHIVLLFFAATITSCKKQIDPSLLVPGISLELAKHRSEVLSNIQYDLYFDLPQGQEEPIHASSKITFSLSQTSQADVILDFNAPANSIKSITDAEGEPIPFIHQQEHIIIPTKVLKVNASNAVWIEFVAGEMGLNRNQDFIYTLLVPDRASTVFPCFDQPDLKARFNLTLDVPKSWEAVSAANVVADTTIDEKRKVTFGQSDVMSTYLFSFVAGKFNKVVDNSGTFSMTMYHREPDSIKVSKNVTDIFQLHRQSIEWLEAYTGIKMPFQKFDFVLIPSFQYGGMEHVGAIQYRASSLMLEASPSPSQLLGRASLIAHETAHMWFGNLVTMRWFDDVWLKEVFANFMAAKIVQPLFPDFNHDLRFLLAHYPTAYSVDRTSGTHAIRQPLENLKQAGSLYGPIIYQKAPIVMRMLEQELGEANFQAGMKEYLGTYANKVADWHELIEILDIKTTTKLDKWSEAWVEKAGRPVYKLEFKQDATQDLLQITQQGENGNANVWPQKFQVGFKYHKDEITNQIRFLNREKEAIALSKGHTEIYAVNFDATGQAYGIFDFGDKIDLGIYPFGYPLLNANLYESPLTRAVLYIQLFEYFLHKRAFTWAYPKLLERYIFLEQEKLNVELLIGQLETIFWRWLSTEQRAQLAPNFEFMLLTKLKDTDDLSMKYTFFQSYLSIATTTEAIDALYKVWSDQKNSWSLVLTERDYIKLSEQLALKIPSKANEIVDVQLSRLKNPDQVDRLKFIAPSISASPEERDAFFASLADAKNRQRETWVLDALRLLHHPLRAEHSVRYLPSSLALLEEIQLTGDIFFPKRWLDESFWGHQSKEAVAVVDEFLAKNPNFNPRLRQKILQSTDILYRTSTMQDSFSDSLKTKVSN